MLLELNRREQTTLILVTHDAELASHADRLINLRDGRRSNGRADETRLWLNPSMNELKQACGLPGASRARRRGKFLFVMLAVAIGVGALTGVRGFSEAFRDMLLRNARVLMAGDLSLRVFHQPRPEQIGGALAARKSAASKIPKSPRQSR